MKLRVAALLLCGLCLAAAATGQLRPVALTTQNPSLKSTCLSPGEGKTAWFDTCVYVPEGNGIKYRHPLHMPDPEYSEAARKAKITGTVVLAVAMNAGDTVDAVKVIRPLEPGLDQNAVDAVKQWKFTSATKDGKLVAVQIDVEVGFRLY